MVKVMKDTTSYLRWRDIRRVIDTFEEPRDRLLFRVCAYSGRRISEVLSLRVKDINPTDREILWHILKKRKEYLVSLPIDSGTLNKLEEFIALGSLTESDYIFTSCYDKEKPLSRQRAWQIFTKACRESGIKTVGQGEPYIHMLRHSAAIHDLENNVDVRFIKKKLQHESLDTVSIYLDISNKDMKEETERVYADE